MSDERAAYRSEESIDKFWGIWNKVLVVLEDGVDRKDGVLPDERVSVFLVVS